jgi:N6-adenosine-specific RNA methylase IME4
MTERLELSTNGYEFTRTGLKITGETTQDDWETLGEGLKAIDEARQWAIGDWLVDGKRHYGDGLYKRAAEITGSTEDTLRTYSSMAGKFELCSREHNLSFKHHETVASLKPTIENDDGTLALGDDPDHEKMANFLANADSNRWTVADLRAKVKKYKDDQRERIRLANEPEKYSVIYADPPWQYTSGDQHGTEEQDTVLGDHYPSMSLAEICDLPVKQMAAENAVLWMWVTSPTLEESFEVIRSWGFKYKASMIWDKVAHNVGNYVSVRHELLLICTKGQPPKVPKLVDSVVEIDRGEHSRKPEYFRELIEELYPSAKRIELFRRGDVPEGWDAWGNEVTV